MLPRQALQWWHSLRAPFAPGYSVPCAWPLRAKRSWRTSCSAVISGQGHAILSTNELKMPTSLARAGNTVFLYPHTVIYCLWRPNLLHVYIKIYTFPNIVLLVQIASIYAKISTEWHHSFWRMCTNNPLARPCTFPNARKGDVSLTLAHTQGHSLFARGIPLCLRIGPQKRANTRRHPP